MLRTRVITALIGLGIAIWAITEGGYVFNILIGLLALLGWREYSRMIRTRGLSVATFWGYLFIFLIFVSLIIKIYMLTLVAGVLAIIVLGLGYIFSERYFNLDTVTYSSFGLLYSIGGFMALILMRDIEFYQYLHIPLTGEKLGEAVIWLLLICTWASDTFAYFAGRAWGKRRIVPKISPNKTLEGFVGGFIGCVGTGLVYAYLWGLPLEVGLTTGLLVGIFAPLGDLFESKIKRTCGVKDSGVLLPGHGGVLDRFDSLLFAAPIVFIYLLQL